MLGRAPWPTILLQFLTSVQTHNSPIISAVHPRKEIWQQLFRLQLSTRNNVSRNLTRPSVTLLITIAFRDSGNPQGLHKSCDVKTSGKSQNTDVTSRCCCSLCEEVCMMSKYKRWRHTNSEAEYSKQEKLSLTWADVRTYDLIYLIQKPFVLHLTLPIH